MTDVNDMERAEAYVADMVWRLEVLQSRSRYNVKTGELKRLPTRLRRFCNGIPQDNVATTLMVLESKAPYSGVVYNGEDDLDNEYRPTRTMIKKDQSLVVLLPSHTDVNGGRCCVTAMVLRSVNENRSVSESRCTPATWYATPCSPSGHGMTSASSQK